MHFSVEANLEIEWYFWRSSIFPSDVISRRLPENPEAASLRVSASDFQALNWAF